MTLEFMVCPHDTASNPERWFLLMQYFAQHLDTHLQFDISLDFTDFRDNVSKADIVYANPSDTLQLLNKGYITVGHPSNLYDEVVFIANCDVAQPTLASLVGQPILSVAALQPTKLALHILAEKGIASAGITDCDSWTSVIGTIWRGEAQYGLIYKDTYSELSDQGKEMIQAFYTSDERISFHNVLVGKDAAAMSDNIAALLHAMHTNDNGKSVLKELNIEQWVPTTPEQIATIKHIMESY